ncbi:MAG: hypothetical protein PHT62_13535 [Desulfotomaculaceae bacterium]|nr:hypothetical protein [Desulfotomaculaceae bacterium]
MKSEFDAVKAKSLIGKNVVIGLSYIDNDDNMIDQEQLYGDILNFNERVVVVKIRSTGNEMTLPPVVDAYTEAPKGEYRNNKTGEVITDPDLTVAWTIRIPNPAK